MKNLEYTHNKKASNSFNQLFKIENIFFILASIFISISIFVMPITVVPDEGFHAAEAWKVFHRPVNQSDTNLLFDLTSHQNGLGARRTFEAGEQVPNDQDPDAVMISRAYKKLFTEKLDLSNSAFHIDFSLTRIKHLPQALGMLIGSYVYPSYGVILTFGRIFNALVYIFALFFIIKYLRAGKLAFMAVSLIPMMIQQAGSLSYDVLNNIAVFWFVAFYINLLVERKMSYKQLGVLCIMALTLYITKQNNLLLLPLLAITDFEFEDKDGFLNKLFSYYKKNRKYILTTGIVVGLIGIVIFMRSRGGVKHIILMWINSIVNTHLTEDINTTVFLGLFGDFGWLDILFPLWLVYFDIIVLTLIFMNTRGPKVTRLEGYSSLIHNVAQVLVVELVMYFWTLNTLDASSNISVGTQGRYFTPFIVVFLPFAFMIRDKIAVKFKEKSASILVVSMLTVNFLVYLYQVVEYYWV